MEVLSMMMVASSTDVVQFSHMFLEIEVPTETFCTNFAGEWLFVVVCVHMEGEIVHLVKGLVADVALVSLVATVCQFMVFIIAFLVESFATEFANKWFVASMNSSVRIEGGRTIESLSACVAFVGLL